MPKKHILGVVYSGLLQSYFGVVCPDPQRHLRCVLKIFFSVKSGTETVRGKEIWVSSWEMWFWSQFCHRFTLVKLLAVIGP